LGYAPRNQPIRIRPGDVHALALALDQLFDVGLVFDRAVDRIRPIPPRNEGLWDYGAIYGVNPCWDDFKGRKRDEDKEYAAK